MVLRNTTTILLALVCAFTLKLQAEVVSAPCAGLDANKVNVMLEQGFRGFIASPFDGRCVPASVRYSVELVSNTVSVEDFNGNSEVFDQVSAVFARKDAVVELFRVGDALLPVMNVETRNDDHYKAVFGRDTGHANDYWLWVYYHELAHLKMRIAPPYELGEAANEALADAFAVYMVAFSRGYTAEVAQRFHMRLIKLRQSLKRQFSKHYDQRSHRRLYDASKDLNLIRNSQLTTESGFSKTASELEQFLYSSLHQK